MNKSLSPIYRSCCWLFFVVLFMLPIVSQAQKKVYDKASKKEMMFIRKNPMNYYEQSFPYISNSDYGEEGANRMEKILTVYPTFPLALQALGQYYLKKKQYRNAIRYYKELRDADSLIFLQSYENYAFALAGDGQFISAFEHMRKFIERSSSLEVEPELLDYYKRIKQDFDFAIQYGKYLKTFMTVEGLSITNMGEKINSTDLEYSPSMSVNAKRMIFTRRALHRDEDLYQSVRDDSGRFQLATPIKELNTPQNEGSASLSTDNKNLLVTYCDASDGLGKCDIYISYYVDDVGWTSPKNLGDKINTPYWEAQPQFGPNNNSIYFSSDRPGGVGGKDLWISYLSEDGEWEEPINLGTNINTPHDEELPFMHHDNETLYFTSDGWPGYGSSDIFLAKRIEDTKWEKPINLGSPINTIDKEGGMIVQFDAQYAYFSSDKSDGNSQGATDIYSYQLPAPFRPRPSTWIQGKVIDATTLQDIRAVVSITNFKTKRTIGTVRTDRNGNFLITLPKGESYSFNILKDGYLFFSDHLNIEVSADKRINKIFYLQRLEVGKSITLANVFFQTDSYLLDEKSFIELDILADMMMKNKNINLLIEGHTDSVGNEAYNVDLSLKRAKAVASYLITKGVAVYRISTEGFGSSKPIASNDDEENRSKNRRSVARITSL